MNVPRKTLALIATLSLGATMLWFAPVVGAAAVPTDAACANRTNDSVRKLLECVTLEGVLEHEEAFQDDRRRQRRHPGVGYAGYDDVGRLRRGPARSAGYDVTRQEFDFFVFEEVGGPSSQQTAPGSVTYVEGTDFAATPTTPSPVT